MSSVQELNALLSTLLADSSTNFYTDTERLQALNSACSYINSELRILRNVVTITVTPLDNGKVPLPSDFVSLSGTLSWEELNGNRTKLSHKNPKQLEQGLATDWDTSIGLPTNYVLEGGNIYLTPVPTVVGKIVMPYLAMPNKLLTDNDLPFYGDVRVQAYHDIISFYAAWQLCLKDRDFEAAQQFMQYFQARMIDLKENLRHTGGLVQPVWSDTYSTT